MKTQTETGSCPSQEITPGTPLPWHQEPPKGTLTAWAIIGADGQQVGWVAQTISDHTKEDQNAAYIVHACNAHPALVAGVASLRAALTDCLAWMDTVIAGSDCQNQPFSKSIAEAARAALAQKEGK